jgi:hypothetical protein
MPSEAFSVIQAEVATGIVLTRDGGWALHGPAEKISASSLEEARTIARAIVMKRPDIECSIRDAHGEHVEFVRGA